MFYLEINRGDKEKARAYQAQISVICVLSHPFPIFFRFPNIFIHFVLGVVFIAEVVVDESANSKPGTNRSADECLAGIAFLAVNLVDRQAIIHQTGRYKSDYYNITHDTSSN
jgi:hypothetical protein